jgi:hypothetical protein
MTFVGESVRFIHVVFGAIGLAAFWVPVFARKGGANHVRFGKIFAWSAYVVLAAAAVALISRTTGLLIRNIGPADEPRLFALIVFLAYLTYVTFVIVRHGILVLGHKRDPSALDTTLNMALAKGAIAASLLVVIYALALSPPNKLLLFALSPIGISTGYGIHRYVRGGLPSKRAWMYEHMGAMLGAGIAFHTAFAVFGSARLFDIGLTGWIAVIPWIAPAVIGIPAITIWTRHYRQKFGELP